MGLDGEAGSYRLIRIHDKLGGIGDAGQVARPVRETVPRIRHCLQSHRLAMIVAGLIRPLRDRAVDGGGGQAVGLDGEVGGHRLVRIHDKLGGIGDAGQVARPIRETVTSIRHCLQSHRIAMTVRGLIGARRDRAVDPHGGQAICLTRRRSVKLPTRGTCCHTLSQLVPAFVAFGNSDGLRRNFRDCYAVGFGYRWGIGRLGQEYDDSCGADNRQYPKDNEFYIFRPAQRSWRHWPGFRFTPHGNSPARLKFYNPGFSLCTSLNHSCKLWSQIEHPDGPIYV